MAKMCPLVSHTWRRLKNAKYEETYKLKISQMGIHNGTYRFQELVLLFCFNSHQ